MLCIYTRFQNGNLSWKLSEYVCKIIMSHRYKVAAHWNFAILYHPVMQKVGPKWHNSKSVCCHHWLRVKGLLSAGHNTFTWTIASCQWGKQQNLQVPDLPIGYSDIHDLKMGYFTSYMMKYWYSLHISPHIYKYKYDEWMVHIIKKFTVTMLQQFLYNVIWRTKNPKWKLT